MKKFKWRNLSIGTKYYFVFAFIFVLILCTAFLIFFQLKNLEENVESLNRRSDRSIIITEMGSIMRAKSIRISDYLSNHNEESVNEFKQLSEQFTALVKQVEDKMDTKAQKNLFQGAVENDQKINELFLEQIIPEIDANGNDSVYINSLKSQSSDLRSISIDFLEKLREIVNKERQAAIHNVQQSLANCIYIFIISIFISLLASLIVIVIINKNIRKNLHKIVLFTKEVARGNLAGKSLDYQGKDEIGQLTSAMNQMRDDIKNIIQKVAHASDSLSAQSEELTQASNEVKEGSLQIATTMQELASGSEIQANNASQLSQQMEEFMNQILQSEAEGQEITETSEEVLEMTTNGNDLMTQSVKQMTHIDQIVNEAVKKVQGLDQQTQKITKLIQVIRAIAEQTNLLSLNAAIEAAHAGEHGKGFAIVAEEVRKLAEQVSSSVNEITNIVVNIQKESKMVVESLQLGYSDVAEGTKQIKLTGETFENIQHSVTNMTKKVQQIFKDLKNITENSTVMNKSIEDIAAISEQSAAGVEQVASAAQQSASSMEEVSRSAGELAKLAEQLNEEIKVFRF